MLQPTHPIMYYIEQATVDESVSNDNDTAFKCVKLPRLPSAYYCLCGCGHNEGRSTRVICRKLLPVGCMAMGVNG